MTQFLLIENPGTVGTDLLTVVGASAARHDESKIGQFGSGGKYAIAKALRDSLESFLYISKDGFTFGVDERESFSASGATVKVREVVMRQVAGKSRKSRPMGFDVSFGEVDWKSIGMALREFVSNSIDACTEQGLPPSSVVVKLVDQEEVRAKAGATRVFIQCDQAVREYYAALKHNFLIFGGHYDRQTVVINKETPTPAAMYRKGVLVGSFEKPSLFNYNINDLEINESRVVSLYTAQHSAIKAIKSKTTEDQIVRFLEAVRDDEPVWEVSELDHRYARTDDYELSYSETAVATKERWGRAIHRVFGAAGVACETDYSVDAVRRKGYRPFKLEPSTFKMVASYGMPTSAEILDPFEQAGHEKVGLTVEQIDTAIRVWEALKELGVTNDREMPALEGFHDVMTAGSNVLGYYQKERDMVGLSKDVLDTGTGFLFIKVAIEEFGHAATGANDETRDLQDWAFRVAAKLLERSLNPLPLKLVPKGD